MQLDRRVFIQSGLALCSALLFPAVTDRSRAQSLDPATAAFNRATANYQRELRSMGSRRGGVQMTVRDLSIQDLSRVLATRTKDLDDFEAGYLPKTGLLFYAHRQGMLEIWLLTDRGIQAYTSQSITEPQLATAIGNLRAALKVEAIQFTRAPHRRGTPPPKIAQPLIPLDRAIQELTAILLPKPIASALAAVQHLMVVPVLGLGTVPYAILQPFSNRTMLIDRMSIAIMPNLYDIGQPLPIWQAQFQSPLVVGNPYLPPSQAWDFPPLPGAEQEARAIAATLGTTPLIGGRATKSTVINRVKAADLLYLATHGYADSKDPLGLGFLAFSAEQLEQGWWTAREVQQTRLRAQIAVLSACQTGLGQVHEAGIIGLARAFQIAGVPRVVMSLWNVDDAATRELMESFVKHFQTQIPAEALRQAMLEVRQQRPNSAEWAAFVFFGTSR